MSRESIGILEAAILAAMLKDVQAWLSSGQPWNWTNHLKAWAAAAIASVVALLTAQGVK
jgi:ABC-type phosphate transport system auxiliary subunit